MSTEDKIVRTNVTEEIARYIRDNINSGKWKEGDKIESEPQMARKLGVSRASVHVAIRQFIAYGKLESIQGKGTFVRKETGDSSQSIFTLEDCADIEKVMQFRITIEKDAAYWAAKNRSEDDVQFIRENLRKMKEADNNANIEKSWEYDMRFHKRIADMSGNQFYGESLSMVFKSTYDLHLRIIEKLGVRFATYYHPEIREAIAAQDAIKAQNEMYRHLFDFMEMIRLNR